MDETEFRQRVYANPGAPDKETLAAARENPVLQQILDETQRMEADIRDVVSSIVVPEGLHNQLLDIAENEGAEDASPMPGNAAAANSSFFQYYAMAACLLLVVGVTFSLAFNSIPSLPELAMGDEVFRHLYQESSELELMDADHSDISVNWNEVDLVMSNAGVQLASSERLQNELFYANPCIILPEYSSAHLMVEGNRGSVNVFVIHNSPVTTEFQIRDERFNGLVVPMDQGNLVLVGEEGENLEQYRDLFEENLEWVI